jgi:thiosulfate dehydrogenase [quinone] large subunit
MTATLTEPQLRTTNGNGTLHATAPTDVAELSPRERSVAGYAWAVGRISIGFVFLWAFLDKAFALGYSTGTDAVTGEIDRFGPAAWIHGGSPTTGFLSGVAGPFKGLFEPLAGAVWADYLFMVGLLAIGVALMLGIGMRVAAASGALLLTFMWMASLPLDNNPFMDDHLIYAVVLIGLAAIHAGDTLGLGRAWARTDLVRRFPVLR